MEKFCCTLLVSSLFMIVSISASDAYTVPNQTVFVQQDTTPLKLLAYEGYRLNFTDLEVVKQKENLLQIKYTVINTGREDIYIRNNQADALPPIVFEFDESIVQNGLDLYQELIIEQVSKQELIIPAGNIVWEQSVKLPIAEVETSSQKQDLTSNIAKGSSENTSKGFQEKTVKETNPKITDQSVPKKKEKTKKEEESGVFTLNIGSSNDDEDAIQQPLFDENNCPDLTIEDLKIAKQNKKFVLLEFKLTNHGTGPANLNGLKNILEDNVAIKAAFSGTSKLSRGAITIGGSFIKNNAVENGILAPGKSYSTSMKLDIRPMTRYTPYIILELDPYQSVRECDETNNRSPILIKK